MIKSKQNTVQGIGKTEKDQPFRIWRMRIKILSPIASTFESENNWENLAMTFGQETNPC